MQTKDLIAKINKLKKAKKAVILVHNYQRPEIYEVADFIGDSLNLCQEAAKTKAKMIVFCGVHFMAESAAILNSDKKVVVPYLDAGCAMADMLKPDDLKKLKKKYPKAKVVCYVNSSAEIKAESDVCCTSANALEVIKKLPEKQIIFIPDKNLADYASSKIPNKEIISFKAFCPAHHSITKTDIGEIRKDYPKAVLIAHPECRPEVLKMAKYIESTSGMLRAAKNDSAKEFFILTECGMTERLRRELPNKKFYSLCNICFDMKKNTLESVLKALESEKPVVKVDKKIAIKAKKAFDKMFALTKKNG